MPPPESSKTYLHSSAMARRFDYIQAEEIRDALALTVLDISSWESRMTMWKIYGLRLATREVCDCIVVRREER